MTTILLFGVGAMGSRLLRVLENDYPELAVVAAVDNAADKAGRRLGEITPYARFGALEVTPDLDAALARLGEKPDVLVHMTESKPARIEGQLGEALSRGLNVLSAAESMFHPALRYPEFAARLDRIARENGVTLSGCGINPGFSYESLPLLLARATSAITSVRIGRCIDVTGTGPGDIEHVGYGLTPEAFREGIASGNIVGHMGGPESVTLVAEYLGLEIDRVTEGWETETADFDVDSGDPTLGILPPGRVIGITQYARGMFGEEERIATRLSMYYRPEMFGLEEADTIDIAGAMPVNMTIRPAVQSLFGAANLVASAIADVAAAPPGFVNLLDMPLGAHRRRARRYVLDTARPAAPGRIALATVPI